MLPLPHSLAREDTTTAERSASPSELSLSGFSILNPKNLCSSISVPARPSPADVGRREDKKNFQKNALNFKSEN